MPFRLEYNLPIRYFGTREMWHLRHVIASGRVLKRQIRTLDELVPFPFPFRTSTAR